MARDWRSSALAALAAAVLGVACALDAPARAAEKEDAEPAQSAPDAPSKTGKKRQDPEEAQGAIEAARKQLQAGRPELALPSLTATLAGGNLPPAIMARAFYVRGLAFRQQRRPAQAISDFNSALWLKGGLGGDERADAIKERAAAYADAGLADSGETGSAPAKTAAGGNFLSNLFGGAFNSSPSPPAAPPPPAAARAEPPADKAAAIGSEWSSTTQSQPQRSALAAAPPAAAVPKTAAPSAPARKATARAAPPSKAASPAAKRKGRYRVQLAATRTESEARTVIAKARGQAALKGREAAIDNAVLGNMGTFYRVRFGPFASAEETKSVCAKLQGKGFDCLPISP